MIEGNNPIQPELVDAMNRLGGILDKFLNQGLNEKTRGFCLLVFDFKDAGMMNYICNAERSTMVKAIQELVEKFEEEMRWEN